MATSASHEVNNEESSDAKSDVSKAQEKEKSLAEVDESVIDLDVSKE